MKKTIASALLLSTVIAQADNLSRPDAHAPIGVMGDHTHHQGEWMLSYRAMEMTMDGNRSGHSRVSQQDVYNAGFLVAPLNMDMTMHMFGAMYAPSDNLTLMAMIPVTSLTMDHQVRPNPPAMMAGIANRKFTTEASGLGDIKIGGLYNLMKGNGSNLIANFTLSIPTGSIDERDVLAMPNNVMQMPYPMQLGSGTYDLIPGITYTQLQDAFSWGAQAKATIRLSDNDNGYTLGDRFALTSWIAKPISENMSLSARLSHDNWQDIDGQDNQLNPMLINGGMGGVGAVPTVRTDLRAGKRTDLGLGVNFVFKGNSVSNHRIALEIARPVAQDLDGPQLETDQVITLGYQVAL